MIAKNNPFNIRYTKKNNWKGQDGSFRGFCTFKSLEYGVRAAMVLIFRTYKRKGIESYSQIIETFAPRIENNTDAYVDYVCRACQKSSFDIPETREEKQDLVIAMAYYESNTYITEADVDWNFLFNQNII